ncbi:hypothetical protein JJB07_11680 [Tumebacillus sp. ITR2]|uniref:Uncharacterized protein n=1 Tax=Tumebacillus amylolyticus TaxID=2801339 RepID=A0ABS1JAL0_9BACL|nr:hypothetical protein [Tumebacillus amylolyticus]MBL0387312.1 hypothetical protein [Tumebacillus amylolyticus]
MKKTAEQRESVDQLIAKLYEMAQQVSQQPNEILKLQTSEFIRSFVDLTQAIEQLDAAREVLLGRAESLLSRPRETEKRLRKEHLKLVINNPN